VHSPWLFSLLVNMRSSAFNHTDIEALRSKLKANSAPVPCVDFGAGSKGSTTTVSGIARRSLKRPKHARALAALAQHIESEAVLELGTSLGLTSAYISRHTTALTTAEGNPHIRALALSNWRQLSVQNVRSFEGEFEQIWEGFADSTYDLIFIDGNHRGEALMRYAKKSLSMLQPNGVLVCDDIHWSLDMEQAWNDLCSMPEWTVQLDAFEWGLLTRNQALKREHVCIRF
jgi:predicted O-methyltransferase YrrM